MKYIKFNKYCTDTTIAKEYEIVYEDDLVFCYYDDCQDFRSLNIIDVYHYEAEIIDKPLMVKSKSGIKCELIKILDECPDGWNCVGKCSDGNYILLKKEELEFPHETLTLEQRIENLEQIINNKIINKYECNN